MLFIKSQWNIQEVGESTYDKEDQMQEYIYENPQILPIQELTGNKKLLVLMRELSTQYWRLDGIWIDEAWNLYIIETKLLRNPDRRNIIAQLLDYGVALWTEYKDPQDLVAVFEKKWIDMKSLVAKHFDTSDELTDMIIDAFKNNLKQWIYQFVAVTDAIEKRILEQIHFVNQSSQFNFFLVDLRYYRHNDVEFIIPKWYWGEIIKNTNVSRSWIRQSDLPEFLDVVETNLWFWPKEFYASLASELELKWFTIEIRVWKRPTMLAFSDKNDVYLFSIYSDTWEIWVNKKSKTWNFNRIQFFEAIFELQVDPTLKQNQFKISFEDYKHKFSDILQSIQTYNQ